MENRKIRISIISGSSMLAVILLTIISMFLQDRTEYWMNQTTEVKFHVLEIYDLLQSAESTQRGFLLTGEEIYLQPIDDYRSLIEESFEELREKTADNIEQAVNVDRYESLCKFKLSEVDTTILLHQLGQKEIALAIVNTDKGERVMKNIDNLRQEMLAHENEQLDKRKQNNTILRILTMFFLLVAASTAGYSLYTLYRQVSPLVSSLNSAKLNLEKTVAQKDLEIEARKKVQIKNKQLIELLVAKNEELNHFAYIASHDLQEPLRTVNNFIEVFKEDYGEKLDDDAHEYFDFIFGATARMKALIEGLLSFSKLGKSGEFVEVDLGAMVSDVLKTIDAAVEEKNAVINIDHLPTLMCLPVEIAQLFQNLVVNAIKFTEPGKVPEVRIKAQDKGSHWEFCVSDNGIGIDPVGQKKIFGMFARLHLAEDYQGQGLGLAFCKKIVELHEGTIWVESGVGEGSSFYFTISKNLKNEEA